MDKPIWVVIGAFEIKGKTRLFKSPFVKPSPNEFRKMVDIAAKEDASGILVFSLTILETEKHHEWNLLIDDISLWQEVRQLPHYINEYHKYK